MASTITDAIGRVDRLIAEASAPGPAAAHGAPAVTTAAPAVPGTDAATNGASTPPPTAGGPLARATALMSGNRRHAPHCQKSTCTKGPWPDTAPCGVQLQCAKLMLQRSSFWTCLCCARRSRRQRARGDRAPGGGGIADSVPRSAGEATGGGHEGLQEIWRGLPVQQRHVALCQAQGQGQCPTVVSGLSSHVTPVCRHMFTTERWERSAPCCVSANWARRGAAPAWLGQAARLLKSQSARWRACRSLSDCDLLPCCVTDGGECRVVCACHPQHAAASVS